MEGDVVNFLAAFAAWRETVRIVGRFLFLAKHAKVRQAHLAVCVVRGRVTDPPMPFVSCRFSVNHQIPGTHKRVDEQ